MHARKGVTPPRRFHMRNIRSLCDRDLGITRVRITGGEPLVRRQCPKLVAKLVAIPGIEDLSLTTNGALLTEHAEALRDAGLSRLNISIDSLNPDRFARITRGATLAPVLAGLEMALELGFAPVKVNAVMIPGIEEELEEFVTLARESRARQVHRIHAYRCHQEDVRNFISDKGFWVYPDWRFKARNCPSAAARRVIPI